MAMRTIYIVLIGAAGIAAGVGGWLFGEELFLQRASASLTPDEAPVETRYPVSNTMIKQDRIVASPRPADVPDAPPNDILETARAWLAAPVTLPRSAVARPEKPSRLFLNDTQIAGIRKRLNLTPAQQKYWQPVETALREVTLQVEDYQKRLKRRDDSFDTNSDAIQRLKIATRALYTQLTGTQKNDLTLLVRMTGLGPAFAELTGTKAAKNASEDSR
ncbi:MAG: hypothetical protein J0G34_08225 [Afipia sp.]|nr:hypothetical protein [Afipia sp.]